MAADMVADRVACLTVLALQELQIPERAVVVAEHLIPPMLQLQLAALVRSGTLYSHDSM
jgi:protein-arginine kinase